MKNFSGRSISRLWARRSRRPNMLGRHIPTSRDRQRHGTARTPHDTFTAVQSRVVTQHLLFHYSVPSITLSPISPHEFGSIPSSVRLPPPNVSPSVVGFQFANVRDSRTDLCGGEVLPPF